MKTAVVARTDHSAEELAIKCRLFAQMLQSIELLHRRFLDVITAELGRRDKALSSVQALILSHASEKPLSIGQLVTPGQYDGTNLSYNINKLAENGYITLSRPKWDKRSSLIELTDQGREVAGLLSQILDSHAGLLAEIGLTETELSLLTRALRALNQQWSS